MDLTTLILIIVIVALVGYFMNRNRTIARGTERPTYDDPNYRSGGSIGGGSTAQPTYDDPDYRSSGSIGGSPSAGTSHRKSDTGGASAQSPRNDDPDYRSGGSIGR
jgi:hypothetical protein